MRNFQENHEHKNWIFFHRSIFISPPPPSPPPSAVASIPSQIPVALRGRGVRDPAIAAAFTRGGRIQGRVGCAPPLDSLTCLLCWLCSTLWFGMDVMRTYVAYHLRRKRADRECLRVRPDYDVFEVLEYVFSRSHTSPTSCPYCSSVYGV